MRIAIIAGPNVPVPPRQYGGTEQVIYYLIKGLMEAKHEPILLAAGDSDVPCKLVPTIPKALFFPATPAGQPNYQRRLEHALLETGKRLAEVLPHVDVVHSHGFDMSQYQDVPNLTTIHGKIDLDEMRYFLDRRDQYFVSISRNQQETCPDLKYLGVAYNGEDPSKFPFVAKPDDYVCFLGRFDREKNPHLAIQLAINLGISIKLGGKIDFQGKDYFDEEIKPLLKHPLVEFLGELNFEQKVELLSKAKCNLHPTGFREPFGLTVLEAAYCGTPTLAIARGSMPELIEEGRTGGLVEDFAEGFHHIQKCFDMDRKYISNRARLLFNYKNMTRDYIEAYKKVIDIYDGKTFL